MKKVFFIFFSYICSLQLPAQPIRYASEATSIIQQIEKVSSVKQYDGIFGSSYTFLLLADTISNKLLKAIVTDSRTGSSRTYYFRNDYLIKVTERFEKPNPTSLLHRFFFQFDYAFAIDYVDEGQKELLERQRLLADAYKLLLYYRQIPH